MGFQKELIIPNEGLPFKLFRFEGGEGNYVREKHWHTVIEIFAVTEGELIFWVDEEEHPLKAGELMIVNSNDIHWVQAPKKNFTVVLQIPLKQFEDYFTAQRFIRFSDTVEGGNGYLASLMGQLYEAYQSTRVGKNFKVYALYYEILNLLVEQYRLTQVREQEIRHSRYLDILSKITAYMREHYREDLRLGEVAAVFGYSDAYLSRMFMKYAKINFKTYLQDIRMAYAYRDLIHTEHTVSQIAMEHGFSSSRAFSQEFRKRYGRLPSQMRESCKK